MKDCIITEKEFKEFQRLKQENTKLKKENKELKKKQCNNCSSAFTTNRPDAE